jgi:hypothetical protein
MNRVQALQLKKGLLLNKEFENQTNLGSPNRLKLLMKALSPKSGQRPQQQNDLAGNNGIT